MDKSLLLQFKIVDIVQENLLCNTYQLKLLNREHLNFRPGQFLTFIIETEREELRRSYSILSLPGEPVKITVKKVENGAVSRHILENWKLGETVYSLAPAGRFSLDPQKEIARDIFCFAAGSGIVPIIPQLRVLLREEPQSKIYLVYSNHNEKEALFLVQLQNIARAFPNFNLIKLFSEPEEQIEHRQRLSNISAELIIQKALTFKKQDAVFLLCGPFAYMRTLMFTIGLMGFRKESIRRENYIPEIMQAGKVKTPVFPDADIRIITSQTETTVRVRSGESILDAALRSGIHIPYSCKGGVCGNCAAKCMKGKVFMRINEVLSNSDLLEGWVLTCTGYAEKDGTVLDFSELE